MYIKLYVCIYVYIRVFMYVYLSKIVYANISHYIHKFHSIISVLMKIFLSIYMKKKQQDIAV